MSVCCVGPVTPFQAMPAGLIPPHNTTKMSQPKTFDKINTTATHSDVNIDGDFEKHVNEPVIDEQASKEERKIFWKADWRLFPILGMLPVLSFPPHRSDTDQKASSTAAPSSTGPTCPMPVWRV